MSELHKWLKEKTGLTGKKLQVAISQCETGMVESVMELQGLVKLGKLEKVFPQGLICAHIEAALAKETAAPSQPEGGKSDSGKSQSISFDPFAGGDGSTAESKSKQEPTISFDPFAGGEDTKPSPTIKRPTFGTAPPPPFQDKQKTNKGSNIKKAFQLHKQKSEEQKKRKKAQAEGDKSDGLADMLDERIEDEVSWVVESSNQRADEYTTSDGEGLTDATTTSETSASDGESRIGQEGEEPLSPRSRLAERAVRRERKQAAKAKREAILEAESKKFPVATPPSLKDQMMPVIILVCCYLALRIVLQIGAASGLVSRVSFVSCRMKQF